MAIAAHHRDLTDAEVGTIAVIKAAEQHFLEVLETAALRHPASGARERASAKTNVQQAAFWAVKSITD